MENKISVYICEGCGIGKCIDIDALCDTINTEISYACCKKHKCLCSEEAIHLIKDDIENNYTRSVVIGACSPRVNAEVFKFEHNVLSERVNLREQLAWCSKPGDENTQMMAEDYLRMSLAKLQNIIKPEPYIQENLSTEILVIGGGISGITAAIEGAKAGYNILLIEKEQHLGGFANKLYKQWPRKYPFKNPEDSSIQIKISEVENLPNVIILKSTTVEEIKGQPGKFNVSLNTEGKIKEYEIASIVMATGWIPYDARKIPLLGYGKFRNVITNIEMEEMAKEQSIRKPSDKKIAESVLFIQCAGSRDPEHLPYCSSYCCATTLKQAKYIREQNKSSMVYIVYKDLRSPGFLELFYKEIQSDTNIFLTKGEVLNISENKEIMSVEIKDELSGQNILIQTDLIVLATGMIPANSEELNLNYRLGKGLPPLKYEFPDSHFICFPYETRRTGIYATGTARAPMDMEACEEDSQGAMLKAIQCVESLQRGESLHPRSGDRSYPKLFLDRCTDCKRCTEECPFGTYDETEKGTPLINPNRCRRCGICVGACPERIIDFDDFSIKSVSAMIKAVNVPDEFEEKPRILVFLCENDAYPAFDMAGVNNLKYSPFIRIIPVRCIGSINKVWISDALAKGFDGILQIGCKPGDDYQCHFINGSDLTGTRSENFQETLDKMMLEPERIRTEFIEINEYHKVPQIINDYVTLIEDIGPNPFKEM